MFYITCTHDRSRIKICTNVHFYFHLLVFLHVFHDGKIKTNLIAGRQPLAVIDY